MALTAFELVPYEQSACDMALGGTLERGAATLAVTYRIQHGSDRVRFAPRSTPPARRDELWRTTCFELFVKQPRGEEYWEYNLAPSGDWNVYRFSRYRDGLRPETRIADLRIATITMPAGLSELRAVLPLPAALTHAALVIGISSVIEDRTGKIHYFALHHAGAKPDFHDPAGFTLRLAAQS